MCLLDVCLWQDVWELEYVNMTTIQNDVSHTAGTIDGFDGCIQDEDLGWMAFQELYIDRQHRKVQRGTG